MVGAIGLAGFSIKISRHSRRSYMRITTALALFTLCFSFAALANNPPQNTEKEWTLLVFLNGNNNLDRFGKINMLQMEKVGSTADINVVVQWASISRRGVQRYYVTKSTNPNDTTSPSIQDLGQVDMGDWKNLVAFVEWGVKNFPAKHYFVDVWDHGSGWHAIQNRLKALDSRVNMNPGFSPFDISWDDHTGHSISTQQLGEAMAQAKQIIGHKVDLYGSDACLMAMAEVANEMSDSVSTFSGSQEVEPGAGWPYDTFLARWAKKPKSSPNEVGKYLTEEYTASYMGGVNGHGNVTFSTYDLSKMEVLNKAIAKLGHDLATLGSEGTAKVMQILAGVQSFTFSDYGDLGDFVGGLETASIAGLERAPLAELKEAISHFVVANKVTPNFARATGISIWLPSSKDVYDSYSSKYEALKFQQNTHWGDTLKALLN
jgi:hypothetical protein